MDDFAARKARTETVLTWIQEAHGPRVASDWAWGCTPMPCGLPDDGQLSEGLALAVGEVTIDDLLAKAEAEMAAASRAYEEAEEMKSKPGGG